MSEIVTAFVEPIGGHRGNDFYDFGLCKALNEQGVNVTFFTCDETDFDEKFSFGFETKKYFNRIYGKAPVILRGIRYLRAIFKTLNEAKKKGVQLVHMHFYHFSRLELFMLRQFRRHGFKVVGTVHDVEDFQKFGSEINSSRSLPFEKRLDRIIVHSDFAKSSLEKYFKDFPASHIHKIPHGDTDFLFTANCSREKAREKLNLPEHRQLILFFGQIKKVKGLDVLLHAFAQMHKINPDAMLLVAGQPWKVEENEFFSLIRQLNISHNCIMRLEHIPSELVPFYFRASNITVLPYRKIYSSGVLIRSLDYGAAIVASDLDVFKAVIADGENGILFQSENAHDLS